MELFQAFAQWGLAGCMIGAIFYAIGWAGQRLVGVDGVLEHQASAMQSVSHSLNRVTELVDTHATETRGHVAACVETGRAVSILHRAAVATLTEVEAECRQQGLDVADRLERVRRALTEP